MEILLQWGEKMKIDEALKMLHKCQVPDLTSYSILQKIESQDFYGYVTTNS